MGLALASLGLLGLLGTMLVLVFVYTDHKVRHGAGAVEQSFLPIASENWTQFSRQVPFVLALVAVGIAMEIRWSVCGIVLMCLFISQLYQIRHVSSTQHSRTAFNSGLLLYALCIAAISIALIAQIWA